MINHSICLTHDNDYSIDWRQDYVKDVEEEQRCYSCHVPIDKYARIGRRYTHIVHRPTSIIAVLFLFARVLKITSTLEEKNSLFSGNLAHIHDVQISSSALSSVSLMKKNRDKTVCDRLKATVSLSFVFFSLFLTRGLKISIV